MADIKITFKDGTCREFKHEGRPGGSYTKTLKLEGGFATVTDEYDTRISFPVQDIKEIKESPSHGRW